MAAGARGARWVCGEGWKPESGRVGAWQPGSLGAAVQAPHFARLLAGSRSARSALATRVVQSPEPVPESPVQSSAVQGSPVLHTGLPRPQRVAEPGQGCVFGCTRTVPVGEPANWRTIPDRGPQVPGARGSGEEGGKGRKGTSRYGAPSGWSDQTGQGAAAELQVEAAAGVTSSSGRHALR